MFRYIHAGLRSLIFLCVLTVQPDLPAKDPVFSTAFLSDTRTSQPGRPIAVRIADPFARPEQELELLKFLNEPYAFQWDNQTTISDIQRDISNRIALQIDHAALDGYGLTSETLAFPDENTAIRDQRLSTSKVTGHWWDSPRAKKPTEQMTNAARIFRGLNNTGLVIATWSGQWLITTEDDANENLSTRLYDVTPVVTHNALHRTGNRMDVHAQRGGFAHSPHAELVDLVQSTVDPDTWEVMGGLSTARVVESRDLKWLVLSTTVMTHWKVQALLNQFNGA